jgi:RNA polymerase sigma-70 factor (ECF subfamily)
MDKDTFTLLVKKYDRMVRAEILNVIPSLNFNFLADLSQETWAKVWEQREQYDPAKSQIQTWLYRVATSVAVDYLRSENAQKRPTLVMMDSAGSVDGLDLPYYDMVPDVDGFGSDAMPPHTPGADEEAIAVQKAESIGDKIDELDRREREILHLAYEEDLSAREIAAFLGLEYDNVRQIMSRSVKFVTGR